MIRTTRILAWTLLAQGVVVLPWGMWRLAQALFGPPVSLGRTGDVVGPPDAVVQFVASGFGVAYALALVTLGVLDLAGWWRLRRRGCSTIAGLACVANALAWSVVALLWLLRSGDTREDPSVTLSVAGIAAVLVGFHLLARSGAVAAKLPPVAVGAAHH